MQRTTKDKYLIEAMRLFSEKGYDAVGVVEIAQAVGCTTSALYKHFKNKQALFEAILLRSREGFDSNMKELRGNIEELSLQRETILAMTVEDQIAMMQKIFRLVAFGEEPRLFRRMVERERHTHPELALLYNEHYIENQLNVFESMIRIWMEGGRMKRGDARMLALEYVSPVIVMISYCDNDPTKREEALFIIERHIRLFNRAYLAENQEELL